MVSLLFVRLSAPDLALTQLLVEIVTVVLVLLAMHFLPTRTPPEPSRVRVLGDGALAIACGAGMAVLTFAMLSMPFETISEYFVQQSKPGGGGTNVVNVILVDFRAMDTLGEVTVLGIAAIGVYAMLDGLRLSGHPLDLDGRPWSPQTHPVMLAAIGRVFLPLALLVSAYLFLRGHNEPGGGFIAGLVTGAALVVEYIAHGGHRAERRLGWSHVSLAGAGILIATVTGLASWVLDYPFLTSTFGYVTLPVVGSFEVASALAFDLGVYLGVVGAVLLVLSAIGRLGNQEVPA
jgi:multicomponent K+:H+ antiporter subunit A